MRIVEVDFDKFWELVNPLKDEVFKEDVSYKLYDILSNDEKNNINNLREHMGKPLRVYLVALEDKSDDVMGWSWGYQESPSLFYMCNSAVVSKFRLQGVYRSLMNAMLLKVKELGFLEVYSRHCMTNNAILIPKLKAGFVISKFELSDIFGALVHLSYHFNEKRRDILKFRSGDKKLKEDLKGILDL